jgi:2-polyprenyl-3-methyl-5-hydroxy-6-metoxy-1,4-benzoquinol methylase
MSSFSRRAEDVRELMDDPHCDVELLFNTYRQFGLVNRLFSSWRLIYERRMRPQLAPGRACRILDVGCGGGDIALSLVTWGARDGFDVRVTAIDTDERALRYVQTRSWPARVVFANTTTTDLCRAGETFDFVVSNHFLHHLTASGIAKVAAEAEQLATREVLFNDLERSRAAHALFGMFGALFLHHSFTASDGRLSIRRGFTREELLGLLPAGWDVEPMLPFRLLAVRGKS